MTRDIECSLIKRKVADAILKSVTVLPDDIRQGLADARRAESKPLSQELLDMLISNYKIAEEHHIPLCQDTGALCVYAEIGQDVHIIGGDVNQAISDAVSESYVNGFLRKSICSPLSRANTKDNSPAFIDWELVPGDRLRLLVVPKGGGCENMSCGTVLKVSDGIDGVRKYILQSVRTAASAPCPPYVLGVGIGGNLESCARLSKKALYDDIRSDSSDPLLSDMEKELKDTINATGIGTAGSGGDITCMRVRIRTFFTHITSLPVFVSFGCNSLRKAEVVI
ncbi:MAG TPA: fumarate hydratase [Spirochaetaceae bacterium]|nr:fumarate hydratase [Spirochaetaceae bacterium]